MKKILAVFLVISLVIGISAPILAQEDIEQSTKFIELFPMGSDSEAEAAAAVTNKVREGVLESALAVVLCL